MFKEIEVGITEMSKQQNSTKNYQKTLKKTQVVLNLKNMYVYK